MDGPNVNWVFFSELRNCRTENDISRCKLLSTGSCSLRAIHGAFKTRAEDRLETQKSFESRIKFITTRQLDQM